MKFYKTSIFQKNLTEFCNYWNTSDQIEYCGRVGEKNPKRSDGVTPLEFAVYRGHPLSCQVILKHMDEKVDDPNPICVNGETVLTIAAKMNYIKIVHMICEKIIKRDGL